MGRRLWDRSSSNRWRFMGVASGAGRVVEEVLGAASRAVKKTHSIMIVVGN